MKIHFAIKLSLTTLLLLQLFGCASPRLAPARYPVPVVTAPTAAPPAVPLTVPSAVSNTASTATTAAPPATVSARPETSLAQESALDTYEVIIDKPAPVQTEVASLLASISPTQSARIAQAVKEGNTDPKAANTINQASPKIRAFIERLSCIRQYNDGGSATLQALAAPSASFQFFVPPMNSTKAHNKSTCLTVSSVLLKPVSFQGAVAIQIKVSYLAEGSGETTTSNHEINKNSAGAWWFTR